MNIFRSITLLYSMSIVAGCTSLGIGEDDFACRGYPDGLRCMSSQDVYKLTNGDDYEKKINALAKIQGADPDKGVNKLPEDDVFLTDGEFANAPTVKQSTDYNVINEATEVKKKIYIEAVIPEKTKGTIPLRTPAKVMRIYIAPWESISGDLNVPSYVYTEIEPRRWMIGNKPIKVSSTLKPLQKVRKTNNPSVAPSTSFMSKPLHRK
jgi:conjugal transfer pilus assembly protein TraV